MPIIRTDHGDIDLTVVANGIVTHVGTEISSYVGFERPVESDILITIDGGATLRLRKTRGANITSTCILTDINGSWGSSSTGGEYIKCYLLCSNDLSTAYFAFKHDFLSEGDEVSQPSHAYSLYFPEVQQPIYGNPVQLNGGKVISPKNITGNGTYDAMLDGADGYNPVVVDVPSQAVVIAEETTDSQYPSYVRPYAYMTPECAVSGTTKRHWWGSNNTAQHWLLIELQSATVVTGVKFSALWESGSTKWRSGTVVFQGSNDGTTFVDLGTFSDLPATETQETYIIQNTTPYLYYRFLCQTDTSSYTGLGKIQLLS